LEQEAKEQMGTGGKGRETLLMNSLKAFEPIDIAKEVEKLTGTTFPSSTKGPGNNV
jgi:hypothetical protein